MPTSRLGSSGGVRPSSESDRAVGPILAAQPQVRDRPVRVFFLKSFMIIFPSSYIDPTFSQIRLSPHLLLPRPHKLVKLRYKMTNTVLTFFQMSDFQHIVFGQICGYCISDHVKAFKVCGIRYISVYQIPICISELKSRKSISCMNSFPRSFTIDAT